MIAGRKSRRLNVLQCDKTSRIQSKMLRLSLLDGDFVTNNWWWKAWSISINLAPYESADSVARKYLSRFQQLAHATYKMNLPTFQNSPLSWFPFEYFVAMIFHSCNQSDFIVSLSKSCKIIMNTVAAMAACKDPVGNLIR